MSFWSRGSDMSPRIIDGLNIQLFDTVRAVTFGMQPVALLDAQGNSLIGDPPAGPRVIGPTADRIGVAGAVPITIDLAGRFSGAAYYAVSPTNMTGITLAGAILTIDPVAVAVPSIITVTGIDQAGASASLSLALEIPAAMPTVTAPLPDHNLTVGDDPVTIDLTVHFAGAATFAVSPAGQGVTVEGTVLTISTAAARDASYTVTAMDDAGQSVTDAFGLVVAPATAAPFITTQPTIRGGPVEGSVLNAQPGAATGNPAPRVARRWLSNGAVIAGATKATFDTTGRAGQSISLRVTWSNGIGAPAVATTPGLVITAAPVAPAFGTDGIIAVEGDDIVLTPPVVIAGTPPPTVTLTATRNGSPITLSEGRFMGGAVPGEAEQVYTAIWTAANGISPDAVWEASLTIGRADFPEPAEGRMNYSMTADGFVAVPA